MRTDPWHYPRKELANQVLTLFKTGLSSALVFFAPRRMGKTEFLCKDMAPLAEGQKWKVFYFSFLELGDLASYYFIQALTRFAEEKCGLGEDHKWLKKISKITGEAAGIKAGIEFKETKQSAKGLNEIMAYLAKQNHILLLLDEVQSLAQDASNLNFIAALRTSLDIHKDNIKVIFTGSSQEGLRRMFSQAKAPFFHFGQNLPFPEFDKDFTDHLAQMYQKVTSHKVSMDNLWKAFQEMQKIPQLARALVERLALNPGLTIEEGKKQLLEEIFDARAFIEIWANCSALERLVLQEIAEGIRGIFSGKVREKLAKKLGIEELSPSTLQSAIRVLQRKELIGRLPESGYFIDDPNFKNWLLQSK